MACGLPWLVDGAAHGTLSDATRRQGSIKWREAPVAVSSNNLHASSRSFCLRTLSFLSFFCFLVRAISQRPKRTVSLPNTPHAVSYVLPTFHTLLESAEQGLAGRRIPVEPGGSKSGAHQWLTCEKRGFDQQIWYALKEEKMGF